MEENTKENIEEIPEEEVEVVETPPKNDTPKVRVVSADEPYDSSESTASENPAEKMMNTFAELKKIRVFGFVALVVSLIGIIVRPLYLEPAAIILAVFDIWKGSKFTRKINIAAIVIALLALLNAWQ
jgi:hypothetical protein